MIDNKNELKMEFKDWEYFLKVASTLHFTRASEQLYLAQPALSRHIRELENELGCVLFKRNNRNVELTDAGIFLQKKIEPLLKRFEKSASRRYRSKKENQEKLLLAFQIQQWKQFYRG